jgi:hypothetical protein
MLVFTEGRVTELSSMGDFIDGEWGKNEHGGYEETSSTALPSHGRKRSSYLDVLENRPSCIKNCSFS